MKLQWHQFGCVSIETKTASLVIDPFHNDGSIVMPKLNPQIVALTDLHNEQTNNVQRVEKHQPRHIVGPGEYEVEGIFIYGIATQGTTLYCIEADGVAVVHPGRTQSLTADQLKFIERCDILLLPITGADTKTLTNFVSQLEPRIVVPIWCRPYAASQPKALDPMEAALKSFGVTEPVPEPRLSLKPSQLPTGDMVVQVLTP